MTELQTCLKIVPDGSQWIYAGGGYLQPISICLIKIEESFVPAWWLMDGNVDPSHWSWAKAAKQCTYSWFDVSWWWSLRYSFRDFPLSVSSTTSQQSHALVHSPFCLLLDIYLNFLEGMPHHGNNSLHHH